jgi:hypothetical protein
LIESDGLFPPFFIFSGGATTHAARQFSTSFVTRVETSSLRNIMDGGNSERERIGLLPLLPAVLLKREYIFNFGMYVNSNRVVGISTMSNE